MRPPLGLPSPRTRAPNLPYVYRVTAFVSIGTLLFGYDQGVRCHHRRCEIERAYEPADSRVTGAVISLYDIGCFIGAMSIGYLADLYGRERTLSIASIVFVVGAVTVYKQHLTLSLRAPLGELYSGIV